MKCGGWCGCSWAGSIGWPAVMHRSQKPSQVPTCPACGGAMHRAYVVHHDVRALVEFSQSYLESG